MKLSVIIPCLNEEKNLKELIPLLKKELAFYPHEIIVVDGGSEDHTVEICQLHSISLEKAKKACRAVQMNIGARLATGDVLYFVHADTRPIHGFFKDIESAIDNGKIAGCYRYRFDSEHPLLKVNGWFTRFNGLFAGGGDQTLFIKKSVFDALGGFNEDFCIMEDFELVRRIKKEYEFFIVPKSIKVSARKYENNSWLKVQWANLIAFKNFLQNRDPIEIRAQYHQMLNHRD